MGIWHITLNYYVCTQMKTAAKHIGLWLTQLMLIGALALLMSNQVWFKHSHIDANGRIYQHAHPYDKGADSEPIKSHNHTHNEFFSFDKSSLFLTPEVTIIDQPVINHIDNKQTNSVPAIMMIHFNHLIGRAPPAQYV
jgi:hypothetical protein